MMYHYFMYQVLHLNHQLYMMHFNFNSVDDVGKHFQLRINEKKK